MAERAGVPSSPTIQMTHEICTSCKPAGCRVRPYGNFGVTRKESSQLRSYSLQAR